MRGNFTGTGEFPAQRASNAENASIWWRHHGYNVSDHHVKSDAEQYCNNWRICLLNDPMGQWGLIATEIKTKYIVFGKETNFSIKLNCNLLESGHTGVLVPLSPKTEQPWGIYLGKLWLYMWQSKSVYIRHAQQRKKSHNTTMVYFLYV